MGGAYDYFFDQADGITESYHQNGSYPSFLGSLTEVPSSGRMGGASSSRSGGSRSVWDEAHLQDMEDLFNNMAILESFGGSRRANNEGIPHHVGNGDDIDIDSMTYEELIQLEEFMGEEKSKGLSEDLISMLPSHEYKRPSTKGSKSSEKQECLICKMEYKRGDMVTTLPCTHQYHETCIKNWLQESKSCCLCKTEVTV